MSQFHRLSMNEHKKYLLYGKKLAVVNLFFGCQWSPEQIAKRLVCEESASELPIPAFIDPFTPGCWILSRSCMGIGVLSENYVIGENQTVQKHRQNPRKDCCQQLDSGMLYGN